MKIKVTPEDFIVKELINLEYDADGAYRIYLLKKKHWNTMDAILAIAQQNKIPMESIGVGGRKDRHAITYQYISVPREYDLFFEMPNVELSFVDFADDYISLRNLKGNYFELTLRRIPKQKRDTIQKRLEQIPEYGFPNYFDDQRFGSVQKAEEFLAERVIKKHYRGVLKLYFTAINPHDKRGEKERKKAIEELWGDWESILPFCRTVVEKNIMKVLIKGQSKNNLVKAINAIHKQELSMHFSAYQSFLWNKALEKLLAQYIKSPFIVKGKIMNYYFYETLDKDTANMLKKIMIPTVSYKISSDNPEVNDILREVLTERDVKPSDFNLTKIRKSFFKTFNRQAIIFPGNFSTTSFEADDIYPGFLKLKMKFTLPPGSFATMLVKSLDPRY